MKNEENFTEANEENEGADLVGRALRCAPIVSAAASGVAALPHKMKHD
jgi:hypothetical protein